MTRKALYGLVLAFLFCLPATAQSKVEQLVFEKANQLYLNGDYSGAREEYQKAVNSGFESAELYYNLGNTYYKLGQIPSAILFYERAAVLNPKDPDIRFNLELANRLVIDKINPVNDFFLKKWIRGIAGVLKADIWGLFSILAFAALLALIVAAYVARNGRFRSLLLPGGSLLTILFAITLMLGSVSHRQTVHPDSAIVFTASLTAKSSPDASGTDLFVIHEGLKVRITDKVGTWIRIRLADGNEGWIPENSIERI